MAIYQIENVTFTYPEALKESLQHVSFSVEAGAFVLLCGPSGSGKTTLLQLLKNEVMPEGTTEGEVLYKGQRIEEVDERRSIEEIGFVFQDPDNQIVMHTAWQELTFAMENLGYSTEQMERRVGELALFFGMESWLFKEIHALSGGQKQLLNLASVMTLKPKVLLLDEPTAQLDPIAAKEFLQMLRRINEELDVTIIMSEHRLEEVYPYISKAIMLENGKCVHVGSAASFLNQLWQTSNCSLHRYIPEVAQLFFSNEDRDTTVVPLTVKDGKRWMRKETVVKRVKEKTSQQLQNELLKNKEKLLSIEKLYFQYDMDTPKVLNRLSLTIQRGEFFALFGGNGSGKSTLLQNIVGILKPQSGKISFKGKSLRKIKAKERGNWIGYVAQNPALYFTKETVREQLQERQENVAQEEGRLKELVQLFSLGSLLDRHPFDISGGEQQKVVIVLALLANPELLLLDEPTKGLDPHAKQQFASMLNKIRNLGKTVLMVSHDIEFAANYATRCGLLFNGQVIAIEDTKTFFQENYFYTTMIHRTIGEWFPDVVTLKDLVAEWTT